jgi:excisionase family DNA binding protein
MLCLLGFQGIDLKHREVNDDLYTVEQVAAKLDVSPKTIRREIAAGKLVPTRIRSAVRIAPADFEEYKKACRSVATARDGKYDFSTGDVDLAGLLRLDQMHSSSKRHGGGRQTTPAQVVPLRTRSRKLSTAG